MLCLFCFQCYGDHRDLHVLTHSFPTRRSSDLVQFLSLLSGGAVRFETAPHARIYGAEFDALWQVARETLSGLVVTANGAWLHAKYTDYPDASGFTDIGIPFGGGGQDGRAECRERGCQDGSRLGCA